MDTKNANTPAVDRGERKNEYSTDSKPQSQTVFNNKDYEDRRNSAACFKNPNKTEDWHADFTGVMVVEGLKDGDKCWVNVSVRSSRRAERYVSVTIKKQGG
jgi:hypothetical protein